MGYLQLSRRDYRGYKGSRIRVKHRVFFQAVRRNHQHSMLKHYKELKVWQKAYELCLEIYRIPAKFPKEERYGLPSQIRRSIVSIPSNIAEIERMLKALIKSLENKPLNP